MFRPIFAAAVRRGASSSTAFPERTALTQQLWAARAEAKGSLPPFLVEKRPADSLVSVPLPVASDAALRQHYEGFDGELRFGKVLEDLDAVAASIAHRHADDNNPETRPLTIVTAAVDAIDVVPGQLNLSHDYVYSGNVTYVGRSSLETTVAMRDAATNEAFLEAKFVMVAKDDSTGKPTPINQLLIETDADREDFVRGEEAMAARKAASKAAKAAREAKDACGAASGVHAQFAAYRQSDAYAAATMTMGVIGQTRMQSVALCQPQQKNTRNKIFGGYLMERAFELALALCHLAPAPFTRCSLSAVDEISFHQPVAIGDILTFDADIVHADGNGFEVDVVARKQCSSTGERSTTNSFAFTFAADGLDAATSLRAPDEGAFERMLAARKRYAHWTPASAAAIEAAAWHK